MLSVLIIDDQKDLLDITRLFLERFGKMSVETATSAKQALTLTNEHTFDALVVDFDLPDISGIEFLKIIRAKGDATPVIIFTGVGREYAAIEALNNGADFFLKKGEEPSAQFRTMVHMINQAVEQRSMGRAVGSSERLLGETMAFFSEPAYAIDRERKIIAWNRAMTELTGIEPKKIIGKGNGEYSLPFFGSPTPMLTDLIFENESTLAKSGYTIITNEYGTIFAWIKAPGKDGIDRVLWMKASALHDGKGHFIAAIGAVRDITDELGKELLRQSAETAQERTDTGTRASAGRIRLDLFLGKAKANYKQGLYLFHREKNYPEAILFFDKALEIDPHFAAAWHDRGMSLRELARDEEALNSIDNAVELEPDNEEFLFNRAELLRKIGILKGQKNAINAAVRAYNRILEVNPNNADAWNCLAACMKELGKEEMSRQYYSQAQDLISRGKSRSRIRNLDSLV
jgi:DNA-binding response OmpR family regulator/Flp pilus assembly protein TadD